MADVSQWSPLAANNNQAPPDGWPEGMNRAAVNNTARETHAAVRRLAEDGAWFDWGHAATFVSGTVFQVPGDQTAVYTANRRVRATQTATIVGTIQSSTATTNTDVTVVWDSGALANEALAVAVGPEPEAVGLPALGSAAFLDVGTEIGDVVQLEDVGGNAGLPAVDGSQLTGITIQHPVELLDSRDNILGSSVEAFDTALWFADFHTLEWRYYLTPASDAVSLYGRVSTDGGATYIGDSGGTDYNNITYGHRSDNAAGSGIEAFTQSGHIGLAGLVSSSASIGGASGRVVLHQIGARAMITSESVNITGVSGNTIASTVSGYLNTVTTGVNAFKFLFSTGNIALGSIRLYGYR